MKKLGIVTTVLGAGVLLFGVAQKICNMLLAKIAADRVAEAAESVNMTVIGGADGPTSIYFAGQLGNNYPLAIIFVGLFVTVAGLLMLAKAKKQKVK